MVPYIHQTQGRIRVRSDFIRHSPASVEQVINQLTAMDGIRDIQYKRYAGSVAILFDHRMINAETLLATAQSAGWLQQKDDPAMVDSAVRRGTQTLLKGLAVMTLKRTLGHTLTRILLAA
ncbi:HMA2 domain-containing protein [Affinibrenneria salicis]|nr:hypothetical protein [Affinibrenneria salicis]